MSISPGTPCISYIVSYDISLLLLPVASCTTFTNELGRIWKESIVPGGTGKIAIRVTRSGPGTARCAHQLSFGMLCRRKSMLAPDSGRCLATVKMHSPEGIGLSVCVCVFVCVCYLGTGSSSASGATHLCRLRGHSLIASAAPRGSRHWRCASS